ncbi:hypothetical protein OAL09_05430 [Verrucomicrobia bacterium]|nr:hypothetical protein [Verrucomicrobiota bacterium]
MALTRKQTLFTALLGIICLMICQEHLAQETQPEKKSGREQILKAIEQLSSDDFKLREKAMQEVWQMGHAAEPFLKEAIKNGNAEMRYRGNKILEEFNLGIYPETPKNIVKLVNQFRKGGGAEREMAIVELAQIGETKLLMKLVKRERDPGIRKIVAQIVSRNISEEVPSLIIKGNYQQAKDLLEVAALDQNGIRNYVAFLLQRDQIETAIEKQRKLASKTQVDAELLAWMLRAHGDFNEAAKVFESMGDKTRARHSLAAGGNLSEYAKSFVDPSRRTTDTLGFAAAFARLTGKEEEFKKITKDIEEYAMAIKDELGRCLNALIINGEASRAFELAKRANSSELFDMEMWRYNFDAAFQSIGIETKKAPYDNWLKKYEENFKADTEETVRKSLNPAGQLATACSLTGQDEEAKRIMKISEKLLIKNKASLIPLIRWERLIGLNEQATQHAIQAMEMESEEDVIDAFFRTSAEYSWLTVISWEFIKLEFPKDSSKKALERMALLFDFNDLNNEPEDARKLIQAMSDYAKLLANNERKKEFTRAVKDLARLHELWELAADSNKEWIQLIGEEAAGYHFMRYGNTLLNAGKPKLAFQEFDKAWQAKKSDPLPLYLKGVALSQSGEKEKGLELKKKASTMSTGDVTKRHFLASSMWLHGDDELARTQDEIILRLASPHESVHPEALRRKYADLKIRQAPASQCAHALEFYLLSRMRAVNANSVISPRNALSYLINLGVTQAKASIENEDAPIAITKIKNLQQINPSDSSMLEDLYQLLVDSGKTDEANNLFKTTYQVSKATIIRFPDHGQHNNNHAWLLSRCSKKLDEALEHANKAVQLEPENGAFLDTLAEVHFQRGDRAKAIEFSEKAVNLLDNDAQVMRQLERFKNGDPSDR